MLDKRVLVTDPLAEEGLSVLRQHVAVDVRCGLSPEELAATIGGYEGLIVRSGTQVTAQMIQAADRLAVIGRAGTGVDNIDLQAATLRGIVVVNVPNSNAISVAEHTIALLLALARHVPQADASLRARRWSRQGLRGTEVRGKRLGIIGLGRIGSAVAQRAQGLEMEVTAHDPFVSVDYAARQGVTLLSLEELLRESDFVSLHVPLTDLTGGMIGARELAMMKPTACLVNCARGGIVDEAALCAALEAGSLAGAALDVFAEEPLADSPLLRDERVILTPHLAATTDEAQQQAAQEIVRQVIDVLRGQVPRYPVNVPPLSTEELAVLGPYMDLAWRLGRFYAQLAQGNLTELELTVSGEIATHDPTMLTASAVRGVLEAISEEPVNLVNARALAERRGLRVVERRTPAMEHFTSSLGLDVRSTEGKWSLMGTVFRGEPHIVRINGFWIDFVARGRLLVSGHVEGPGILGRVGTLLGEAGINISFVQVGRQERGGQGVMVLGIDDQLTPEVLQAVLELPSIRSARSLWL
jgi:D-3-phosphoglycerate dehydrogenase